MQARCAALVLGSANGGLWNEWPPPNADGSAAPAGPVERAAFSGWLSDAASAGSTPGRRKETARQSAAETHGALPSDLDEIRRCRFPGGTFQTPAKWAAAEWAAQWDETVEELCDSYERALAARIERATGERHVIVAADPGNRVHDRRSVEAVMRLHRGATLALSGRRTEKRNGRSASQVMVALLPSVVADWVEAASFDAFHHSFPARPGDPSGLAETALALHDPDGEEHVRTLDASFETARLVLDPSRRRDL